MKKVSIIHRKREEATEERALRPILEEKVQKGNKTPHAGQNIASHYCVPEGAKTCFLAHRVFAAQ